MLFSMGVYTLVAGLLGTVSNSLAISVFCKTPKVTFNLSRYIVHCIAHQLLTLTQSHTHVHNFYNIIFIKVVLRKNILLILLSNSIK